LMVVVVGPAVVCLVLMVVVVGPAVVCLVLIVVVVARHFCHPRKHAGRHKTVSTRLHATPKGPSKASAASGKVCVHVFVANMLMETPRGSKSTMASARCAAAAVGAIVRHKSIARQTRGPRTYHVDGATWLARNAGQHVSLVVFRAAAAIAARRDPVQPAPVVRAVMHKVLAPFDNPAVLGTRFGLGGEPGFSRGHGARAQVEGLVKVQRRIATVAGVAHWQLHEACCRASSRGDRQRPAASVRGARKCVDAEGGKSKAHWQQREARARRIFAE